jgi:hypothetical protein
MFAFDPKRTSRRHPFSHLTWIKVKAATYELSCWLLPDGQGTAAAGSKCHAEAVDASTSNKEQAMPSKFAEVTSRNFSTKLAPELSDEARKAVNAAFDAMSTWRTETVDNFEIVIDKVAAAARALGWPQQVVDATHAQMQDVIKMQIHDKI